MKSLFCAALLTIMLVGNVLAGNITGIGFLGFFETVMNAVVELVAGPADCKPRVCQQCRPTERDENGNCRPT